MTVLLIVVITLIPLLFLLHFFIKRKRRKELLNKPLDLELIRIVEKNINPYKRLSDKMKKELQGLINLFLYEKNFEGCGGLEINDEIRVTIAAEACLLLLNKNITECFPDLHTILVYPYAYVASASENIGNNRVENIPSSRAGESWQYGNVVLAWDHVKNGIRNFDDAHNVVLHEFGHQLDQMTGVANGAPPIKTYHTWARVLGGDFEDLCEKVKKHKQDVLDAYGATNPAEFFAVATETFFEKPEKMKDEHPELFQQFLKYYQVNPMEWE